MFVINFDICAIILLAIILVSNIYRGMTHGKTNKYFLGVICLALLASVGDCLSGYGANRFNINDDNRFLMYAFNYLYFACHSNIIFIYFMYCVSSMSIEHIVKKNKIFRVIIIVMQVLNNLIIVANLFTNKLFWIDERMQYQRGPLLAVLYTITGVVTILYTIAILKYRKFAPKYKWMSLLSMMPAYFFALLVQGLFPHLLVEKYILAILIILFVFVVQSQDAYQDPVSGAKKYNSGVESLKLIMSLGKPVNVLMLKFVNNKNIRMYLGQQIYNKLLHDTSDAFNAFIREVGIDADLYYLESGLFALLADDASEEKMIEVAKKIKDKYSSEIICEEMEVLIDARICFIECPKDISDFSALITFGITYQNTMPETSEILYYRDYVNDKEFIIKNHLEEIINRGLMNKNFEIHYQPVYSIIEKKYVSAEAFLRLKDEEYGDISPALFIPVAEVTGSIHNIGNFVLESVCKFIADNDIVSLGLEYIQINMSASQCIEVDLVDKIRESIEKYNIDSSQICLEITESIADFDPVIVDHNVTKLRELGIRFLLDDYGTGYSNVMRLTTLPIDIVKLDREFINRGNEEKSKVLIEETIKMLKEMDKKVLVQGIENKEAASYFEKLGCDYMLGCEFLQGFYYSKDLPDREFIQFIKDHSEKLVD